MLKGFDLELIIYDETENFREWDDGLFMYPYMRRKNILNSYKFELVNDITQDY